MDRDRYDELAEQFFRQTFTADGGEVRALAKLLREVVSHAEKHGRAHGSKRHPRCACGRPGTWSEGWDAYYCPSSGVWLEEKCSDPTCRFCAARPNECPVVVSGGLRDRMLNLRLSNGTTVHIPIDQYPRLAGATPEQLIRVQVIAGGQGLRWPDLDEDIAIERLTP